MLVCDRVNGMEFAIHPVPLGLPYYWAGKPWVATVSGEVCRMDYMVGGSKLCHVATGLAWCHVMGFYLS